MKIILLIILFCTLLFNFSCKEQKLADSESKRVIEIEKLFMERSQDSLQDELYNINFATKITLEKIKQGMSINQALKFKKHLIDSLNKRP